MLLCEKVKQEVSVAGFPCVIADPLTGKTIHVTRETKTEYIGDIEGIEFRIAKGDD